MQSMYYTGLDVHKKTISYCMKDGSGCIHAEPFGGSHELPRNLVSAAPAST
jgi:hypothetical protein